LEKSVKWVQKLFGQHLPPMAPVAVNRMTAQLNHRIQPIARGERYEDPLHDMLISEGLGEVEGGGTMVNEDNEIMYVDVEIMFSGETEAVAQRIIIFLENAGAPKGSKLIFPESERTIEFGKQEGLALYLNGTDLADEVYEAEDPNVTLEELNSLLAGAGSITDYWNGNTETALYAYGSSFAKMKSIIDPYVERSPNCQLSRIVQIA
jgi:hypothetical protein